MAEGSVSFGRGGYDLWNRSLFERIGGKPKELTMLDDEVVDFVQLRKRVVEISQMPANIVPRHEWAISCSVKS